MQHHDTPRPLLPSAYLQRALARGDAPADAELHLPGMVHAVVARPPSFGARLRRCDTGRALALRGVIAVIELHEQSWREEDADGAPGERVTLVANGVAVIARTLWDALQGRRALDLEWDACADATGDSATQMRDVEHGLTMADAALLPDPPGATAVVDARYLAPYLTPAPLEPGHCIADVARDAARFWTPAGDAQRIVRDVGVKMLGLPAGLVSAYALPGATSFGRRLQIEYVAEAALLSLQLGRPVSLGYSREDDMQRGLCRPMSGVRIRASVDADGMPLAWRLRTVATTTGAAGWDAPASARSAPAPAPGDALWYPVAALRREDAALVSLLPRASGRAPLRAQEVLATECFIDELARHAGQDSLAYRLRLLQGWAGRDDCGFDLERLRAVLALAAGKADWHAPLPAGWGRGIACLPHAAGAPFSYIAQVVEVAPDARGGWRVQRIVSAVDGGLQRHPGAAQAEVDGASLLGLGTALREEMHIVAGKVRRDGLRDEWLRPRHRMPRLQTHLVRSTQPPGRMGEAAAVCIVAAVANAVTAARGTPVRRLPLASS